MAEFQLSYTGSQINSKLAKIDSLAEKNELPTKTSDLTNDSGFITNSAVSTHNSSTSAHTDIRNAISKLEVEVDNIAPPAFLYELADDANHRTVTDTEKATWNAKANTSDIPTKVSQLTNDSGYLKTYTETDPTVPAWAKASTKPTYTASEVGAVPTTRTVNGKALSANITLSASDVGADASGTASSAVSAHNISTSAHTDIRGEIENLQIQVEALRETTFTNMLLTAVRFDDITQILTGDDGSVGYLNNTRITGNTAYTGATGWDTTGLIPAKVGDVIRLKNVTLHTYSAAPTNGNHGGFAFYDASGAYVSNGSLLSTEAFWDAVLDEDGNWIQFTIPNWDSSIAYVCIICQDINERSIITVNEEIVEADEMKFSEIESAISELSTKVEAIENSVSTGVVIPTYWQAHLDERVEDIRRAMEEAGRNKSAFFFYSDAHWSNDTVYTAKLAPTLLKYLYKKTSINKTNFGGDIVNAESYDTDIMAYLWDWREQLRDLPNHHSVIGNHDDGNSIDKLLSKEYVYAYLLAPEESNDIVWGGDFYYYIDNKCEKTRYLYIDIMYENASESQLAFIKESLISTPTDWNIVAIAHAWFANDYSVNPPVLNGFDTIAKNFLDMFDSYNARSGEYASCGGTVRLCIGGHYHLDHYDYTNGGIPVVIVEADTLHNRSGTMPQKGTTDESAVSAVICDYNTQEVKVIRIGRGSSYAIPLTYEEPAPSYTNLIPLSVDTDGVTILDGVGYRKDARISAGSAAYRNNTGTYCTGFVPINTNEAFTVYLKNVKTSATVSYGCDICFFPNVGQSASYSTGYSGLSSGGYNPVFDADGNLIQFSVPNQGTYKDKYFTLSCIKIDSTSIITINEPIE